MTPEKVIEVAQKMAQLVRDALEPNQNIKSSRVDPMKINPTRLERLRHFFFMCTEIETFVHQGKMNKAMRWLGFVQGMVWTMLPISIDSLKDINRPLADA